MSRGNASGNSVAGFGRGSIPGVAEWRTGISCSCPFARQPDGRLPTVC